MKNTGNINTVLLDRNTRYEKQIKELKENEEKTAADRESFYKKYGSIPCDNDTEEVKDTRKAYAINPELITGGVNGNLFHDKAVLHEAQKLTALMQERSINISDEETEEAFSHFEPSPYWNK